MLSRPKIQGDGLTEDMEKVEESGEKNGLEEERDRQKGHQVYI